MVAQRYTIHELKVMHIKSLFSDLVTQPEPSTTTYTWQPLPVPVNGRVQRAIAAYTA